MLGIPAPYTSRAARLEDAAAVAVIANAQAVAAIGEPCTSAQELAGDWQSPGRDLEGTTRIVLAPDGSIVAGAFLDVRQPVTQPCAWGEVVPAHRRRGLGAALVDWAEARAVELVAGAPAGSHTVLHWDVWVGETELMALLAGRGFGCVRHFWRMDVDLGEPPDEPAWPDGIGVRTFRRGDDERRTYDAVTEAFRDHWGDDQRTFEQWEHGKITGPAAHFDPALWFLAVAGGEVVGVSLCRWESDFDPAVGYLSVVGVRPAWRRRGLARALLLHTFAAFRERGRASLALHVDAASPTGALALYEGVGMRAQPCFEVWEKPLRASPPARGGR